MSGLAPGTSDANAVGAVVQSSLCPAQPLPYPLDLATFRIAFPMFADPVKFPDAGVQVWLDVGCSMVSCAWGSMAGLGQGWFAAHELAKMAMAEKLALQGDYYGIGGPMSNKSVGPVSVGYDIRLAYEQNAGPYNLTVYGQQFYHYAQLFGMGPIQVGAVTIPPYGTGRSWLGPPPIPGWFG